MGFAPNVNVHQQTDDWSLEIVVHPHVALVVVVVHEVEPDVIAALPQACMVLSFVWSVETEVGGKQLQNFFGRGDASIAQQTELIVAGESFAHPEHRRDCFLVVVDGP